MQQASLPAPPAAPRSLPSDPIPSVAITNAGRRFARARNRQRYISHVRVGARRASAAGGLVWAALLTGCPSGYGPAVDQSRFVSAKLSDDGRTAIFTFQRLVYRPAEGMRAFPDGGIPRYLEDEHWIGHVDLESGESRILAKQRNVHWAPGQGSYHVQQVVGATALLGRGGQRRYDLQFEYRSYLLDVRTGSLRELSLRSGLAELGRAPGYAYLVREDGLLVLVTPSLAEAEQHPQWSRVDAILPEIWLREPGGGLRRVAASHHYEGFRDGGVFYWSRRDRRHRRYDVATGETRGVEEPRFATPDLRIGVGLSSDRRSLELQSKTQAGWRYEPLPVEGFPVR